MNVRKSATSPIRISRIIATDAILDLRPQRLRHIDAARRRALLPLVLEPAAHDRDGELLHVGRRMRDDEVLAAGFADQPRIAPVAADVLARRCVHIDVEDGGAAGEVNAGQVGRIEQDVRDLARRCRATKLMTPGGRPAASSSLRM